MYNKKKETILCQIEIGQSTLLIRIIKARVFLNKKKTSEIKYVAILAGL